MPEPLFLTTPKGERIRILTPDELDRFLAAFPEKTPRLKTLFNVCFYLGMRYIEVQRLHKHPEWWQKDRNLIYLPREAQLKVKRTTPERKIPVPPQLTGELPYFFKNRQPPCRKVWGEFLQKTFRKAFPDETDEGIVPKMTRASIESWMYTAGMRESDICLRQGHDNLTSLKHYHSIGFKASESAEIKTRMAGWWPQ